MKAETKAYLKEMAILVPVAVFVISVITVALYTLERFCPWSGTALGTVLIIALIGGTALALERGWLD